MTRKSIIKLIRADELRRFRDYVEDRPIPYTRYVIDQDMLARLRDAEYAAEVEAAGSDSFAAYWAGSASALVMRDYRARRVITCQAK
jgi:hypothetical protein